MTIDDFDYHLPESLIARYPLSERTGSRLMVVHRKSGLIEHREFTDLKAYLNPKDLLVFNNSKVMKARLYGHKSTGGQVEFLVERVLSPHEFLSHIRTSKALRSGQMITLDSPDHLCQVLILDKVENFYRCQIVSSIHSVWDVMRDYGHIPLPPYFHRDEEALDETRYQTVYADPIGSAAAPTAGLHFSKEFLADLDAYGVHSAFVTLHVGAGTFQPVRTQNLSEHLMHQEWLSVSKEACDQVSYAQKTHQKVIAVGTTSVRALETAAEMGKGQLLPYEGESRLFLYPGKKFHVIDGLLTNFHLPKSTLLMLVSAFAGTELIAHAYQLAIEEHYRFFSYGDAMFIL